MDCKRLTMEICGMGTLCLLSACITKPIVDVTKAPFKASSELSRGTTDATIGLTEPTKEFTSGTSPRSWFTQDGVLKAEYKLMAFTAWNFDNLRENLAQAGGEYIESYATLLGIAPTDRADFNAHAQRRYGIVFSDDVTSIQSVNIYHLRTFN